MKMKIRQKIEEKIREKLDELEEESYDEMTFDELVDYIYFYRNNPTEIAAIVDAIRLNPNLTEPEKDRLYQIISEVTKWW